MSETTFMLVCNIEVICDLIGENHLVTVEWDVKLCSSMHSFIHSFIHLTGDPELLSLAVLLNI